MAERTKINPRLLLPAIGLLVATGAGFYGLQYDEPANHWIYEMMLRGTLGLVILTCLIAALVRRK